MSIMSYLGLAAVIAATLHGIAAILKAIQPKDRTDFYEKLLCENNKSDNKEN